VATMTSQSRRVAGIVLIVFPTVVFGGVSVLTLLVHDPTYADNAIRQNLWRAGHAHAGVLLLLTLVVLRYVDETGLSEGPAGMFGWPYRPRRSCYRSHSSCPCSHRMPPNRPRSSTSPMSELPCW
jgi:hypothetical protein